MTLSRELYVNRAKEKDHAFMLAIPAFLLCVLPIAVILAASFYTGRNEFADITKMLRPYYENMYVGLMMAVTVPLVRVLMIVVISDLVEDIAPAYFFQCMTAPARFYLWRLSPEEWILWIGYFVGSAVVGATSIAVSLSS